MAILDIVKDPDPVLRKKAIKLRRADDRAALRVEVAGERELIQRREYARVDAFLEVAVTSAGAAEKQPAVAVNISGSGAVISRLEEEGAWRLDDTRTPREYLRLLPADHRRRRVARYHRELVEVLGQRDEAVVR